MKRLISLLLALLLLSGCSFSGGAVSDPVTFYYLRSRPDNAVYDDYFSEGIIGSEEREASGRQTDLGYLLTVYFRGPLNTDLVSPFPMGCRVLEIQQQDTELTLLLNPILAEKSDLEITVACACLAKTCMATTGAETVRIESRNLEDKILFSRLFTGDNLFLNDNYTQPVESTEKTQ